MRWQFTVDQQRELLKLGLYPEQVHRLGLYLPSIGWRCAPGPRMQDVRDKLTELAKLLERTRKLYVRMFTSKILSSQEASSRLYLAQEELNREIDAFQDSLETSSTIVDHALSSLLPVRRSTRKNTAQFVSFIVKALQAGHGEHFVNLNEPMPPFLIEVARKKQPFPEIARIVSEASGGWGFDDAIRAYLRGRVGG
jgi:hypothetical protein